MSSAIPYAEDAAKEFFNKVKGKKIRWSVWRACTYFVPEQLHLASPGGCPYMTGVTYYPDDTTVDGDRWFVMRGFGEYGLRKSKGRRWHLLEQGNAYLIFE